jgi:RHS repeat-associated protein
MITSWSKQNDASTALTSNFGYDAADQLISASVPLASGPTPQAYQYQYDLAGNRTSAQIDPVVTSSSYNNLNQLVSQAGGGNMVFNGKLTSNNNPVALTLAGQPATVDTSGNWRGAAPVTVGANSIPLVATDANGKTTTKTITIVVSGGANRTLTYVNGNLTNDGNGKVYTYDAANRLSTITQGSNVSGFVYDRLGRRVQETLNGALIKQWVWCGGAQPCEERDGSNNVTKRFYTQGEQITGTNYYYTKDTQGSIREMTDSTGAIRARYDYDPYGRTTKLAGDLDADFRFQGMYYHVPSGDYMTRHRIYDPVLARWTTPDPIGEAGGINLFQFVGNDPINNLDPLGLTYLSNTEYLLSWGLGLGSNVRNYNSSDVETQEMMNSPGVNKIREQFYEAGCKSQTDLGYGTGEAYYDTLFNPHTADLGGTAAEVGGYTGARAINNGNGSVTFIIPNVSGTHSFFLHGVPDRSGNWGPMRNIYQTFKWTEPISKDGKCPCKK